MEDSIFTKIINGDIPAHKIYEDENVLAFLDIYPAAQGHTLVIPKKQIDHLWDLPEADYSALMLAAKKIAIKLRSELGVARVGVKVVGVDVPHAHVHLIPFNETSEYNAGQDFTVEPDHQALAALAAQLSLS
jgi:histidine triad (HIT) family protein